MASDPGLVEAFRRQCATAISAGMSPGGVYLMWRGEPGIEDDDLIDVLKEFDRDLGVPRASAEGESGAGRG